MIWKLLSLAVILLAGVTGIWFFGARDGRPELDLETGDTAPSASIGTAPVRVSDSPLGWRRFRGPNGTGVSADADIPIQWSDTENLAWKTELPGYGASSPVLTDEFVFLTSYSGYGTDVRNPGDINQLKRQLLCVAREDGRIVWSREFASEAAEDPYQGMGVPEHGYATNTPVTDGKRVYAFLGKSGVVAFDLAGNELWKTSVGTGSSNRRWGSAASLIMANDLVIVNAAEESKALYALNAETGEVAWKSEAATLELCFSTPAIRQCENLRQEILLAVPSEVWALNPENGKLIWYVETAAHGEPLSRYDHRKPRPESLCIRGLSIVRKLGPGFVSTWQSHRPKCDLDQSLKLLRFYPRAVE